MKDCFILPFKNITYMTAERTFAIVAGEGERHGALYNINISEKTLEHYYIRDYGYYIDGKVKICKGMFLCEVERANFYA